MARFDSARRIGSRFRREIRTESLKRYEKPIYCCRDGADDARADSASGRSGRVSARNRVVSPLGKRFRIRSAGPTVPSIRESEGSKKVRCRGRRRARCRKFRAEAIPSRRLVRQPVADPRIERIARILAKEARRAGPSPGIPGRTIQSMPLLGPWPFGWAVSGPATPPRARAIRCSANRRRRPDREARPTSRRRRPCSRAPDIPGRSGGRRRR